MQQSAEPARSAPRRGARGYGKGDDMRARLISEALRIFGDRGYSAATTRELAAAAGTTLPSLTYYFGGKEGLYIACAEAIVERYERATGDLVAAAQADLGESMSPESARDHLKSIFRALVQVFTGSDANRNASFAREALSGSGSVFELLYSRLWQPGIELIATLITQASRGRFTENAAKLRAIMMISSMIGFSTGREVITRAIGPGVLDDAMPAEVAAVLDDQIDQITARQ